MATKTIGGKRWDVSPKDDTKLTRQGVAGATLKLSLESSQGYTACGGTDDAPCEYYRPIRSDCPVCGKPRTRGTTPPAKTPDTLDDDMVALIATLTVCIQNDEDPQKPDSPEPTTKDYVAAVSEQDHDKLKELATLQNAWETYNSFANVPTRKLNKYKNIIKNALRAGQ